MSLEDQEDLNDIGRGPITKGDGPGTPMRGTGGGPGGPMRGVGDGPGTPIRGLGPGGPIRVKREEVSMKRGTGVIFEAIERYSICVCVCVYI